MSAFLPYLLVETVPLWGAVLILCGVAAFQFARQGDLEGENRWLRDELIISREREAEFHGRLVKIEDADRIPLSRKVVLRRPAQ